MLDNASAERCAASPGTPTIRRLSSAAVGNALEWFDWSVYSSAAIYLAPRFFPPDHPAASLLAVFAVFAVGFFVRPLGGWLLGALADRHGRKAALFTTVVAMSASSAGIAVMPTYDRIGMAAPVLLCLARVVQGLAVGGEFGAASAYLTEMAPPAKQYLYSSVFYVGTASGMLVASGVTAVCSTLLSTPDMASWGWRIGFAVGACGAGIGWWIRRSALETMPPTAAHRRDRQGLRATLAVHRPAAVRIVGFSLGPTLVFYIFATYLPSYAVAHAGASPATAAWANTLGLLVMLILLPLFGQLADRRGPRVPLLVFAGGFTVLAVPLALEVGGSFLSVLCVQIVGLTLFSLYGAVAPALMATQFPADVRAAGVGVPYNIATAVFGGTAPYLLTWLTQRDADLYFFVYLATACLISGCFYWRVASAPAVRALPQARQPREKTQ